MPEPMLQEAQPERYLNTEGPYEQYKYPTGYDYYQEYEHFQQKIKLVPMVPMGSHQGANRKRRIIPAEEMRDYMIDLAKVWGN
jgi:hypothetical protein